MDSSSGRIHRRYEDGDRLLVDERCNLDLAGAFRVVTAGELEAAEPERFCEYCFQTKG